MNKRAQEEMVGFVLIVVLIVVVLVIALVIFLKNPSPNAGRESIEASQFLESALEYTTDCQKYAGAYASMSELIGLCYAGKECASGEDACSSLNKTISEIIQKGWNINKQGYYSGYSFNSMEKEGEVFFEIKGNCTEYIGASQPISYSGNTLENTIKICLG